MTDEIVWHEGEATIDCILNRPQTREIPQGQRNATMSHFAGRVVKRYGATDRAHEIFLEEAQKCSPPLDDDELAQIWHSACRFAIRVQAQDGYIRPDEYNNEFCRESLKPSGIPVVCKLLFDGLMDFSGEGAWLPVMSKDGIPAYIKARST